MSWRWLILDYIPPELGLTSGQRKQARRRMYRLRHRVPVVNWVLYLFGPVAGIVGCHFIYRWLAAALVVMDLPEGWAKCSAAALALLGFTIGYALLLAALYVGPMRRALREMGYEVCVRCGYWLRGLGDADDRCPECGSKRQAMPPLAATGESSPAGESEQIG
ncbi:MAG: hypothetical protein JSV91_06690 [Phycisphaerales bacterium]|nr:MAG: hypothetical protein JSV91_06690 [Phycisphaerales bacterium]